MNDAPTFDLSRTFQFLDWVIDQYGIYLFMAFVFLCPLLILWAHRCARKHPPVGYFRQGPPPRDPTKHPVEFNVENYDGWL